MAHNKQALIIDTGFFVALLSKRDFFHTRALEIRPEIENRQWHTTWPVLTETSHLLGHAFDGIIALYQKEAFQVFDLHTKHAPILRALLKKYQDLPMDLADASLVILAEELKCGDIVSTDRRDFNVYRFKNHKPFHNLME